MLILTLTAQETMQVSPQGASARFRPYASPNHHVTKGRYITSNDPRGYMYVSVRRHFFLADLSLDLSMNIR